VIKTTHKNHRKALTCAICGQPIKTETWYNKVRVLYDERPRIYPVHQLCLKFGVDYIEDHLGLRSFDFKALTPDDKTNLIHHISLRSEAYERRITRCHRPRSAY